MPASPKVSVLMPTCNYARYLPLAIESVLNQDFTDFELIIQDACSKDNTAGFFLVYRLHKSVKPFFKLFVKATGWRAKKLRPSFWPLMERGSVFPDLSKDESFKPRSNCQASGNSTLFCATK